MMGAGITDIDILNFAAAAGSPLPRFSHDFEASSSQNLSISDADFGVIDANKIGISAWVKRESTGTHYIAAQWGATAATSSHRLFFSTDKIAWGVQVAAGSGTIIDAASITDTDWHHIYATYDGTLGSENLRLWLDGSRVTSFSSETQRTGTLVDSANAHSRGARSDGAFFFDGLIYQCAFFSGTLPDISDLYDAGAPKDIRLLSGLVSLLDPDTDVMEDMMLSADWTNNNSVVLSPVIP